MKKVILLTFILSMISMYSFAHPPKKVNLSFNKESGVLSVSAVHQVKDVTDHYLYDIVITVDGKVVKELKPEKQSSPQKEDINVTVPEIKTGSKVEVKAKCNKGGAKTGKLVIN